MPYARERQGLRVHRVREEVSGYRLRSARRFFFVEAFTNGRGGIRVRFAFGLRGHTRDTKVSGRPPQWTNRLKAERRAYSDVRHGHAPGPFTSGDTIMSATSSTLSRRTVLAASAAASATNLLSGCSHRGGQHRRAHRNPPVLLPRPRTGACRNAPARQRGDLAGAGNGRGCISGRAARHDAEARALLGDRLRLAQGRGADQCAAATSSPRSTGSTFTSFTFARSTRMRCR